MRAGYETTAAPRRVRQAVSPTLTAASREDLFVTTNRSSPEAIFFHSADRDVLIAAVKLDPIITFARRHHGLITLPIGTELGMSRRAWYWAIESGRLEQLHAGVARLPGAPTTAEQQILAAVWAYGDGGMASHRSAAHLWCPGGDAPATVDVLLARGVRRRTVSGAVVHRPTDRGDLRAVWRHAIPVTNPLRTLVDLGEVAPHEVRLFFERVVVAGFVGPAAAWAAVTRHAEHGRQGPKELRAVLEDWTMNEKPPDSVLEEAMSALLARHALPPATFHPIICGFEPDFLVGRRVVVECDGWATHGLNRRTFENDRARDVVLTAAGYAVVRFTWRQVRRQGALVARRLRSVLQRVDPECLLGRICP
jgi:very-short-patch-repair endonuclease